MNNMEASNSPDETSPSAASEWSDLSSIPFASGDIMNMSDNAESFNKTVEFTPDNTKEYWKNRARENYDLLKNKSPDLAKVYSNIVNEQRQLAVIKLTDMDVKNNAHFNSCGQKAGKFIPEVAFNLSHMETYAEPSLDTLLRQVSIQLGAKFEDIKSNEKLVSTFIMLHEFGHGADFIDNFLKPQENRGRPISEVLKSAVKNNHQRRLKDLMTMPVPQHIDFSKPEDRKKYRKRLAAFGIEPDSDGKISSKKIRMATSIAYRETSSESIADSFAKDYIMKHRDEYFLPIGGKDDGSGRIKTGEKIEMNEEDTILSGIRDGKNITLTKIGQQGESQIPVGYSRTGFILGQLELGRQLNLVQDVYDPKKTQTSNIISMERQLLPNGNNIFTAKTTSGATYQITRNPQNKPKQVNQTAEQMNNSLGISAGSEIIIMKRDIKGNDSSKVMIGKIIDGKIVDAPKIGASLRFEGGGHTTSIQEIRRIWRTWLFKTSSNSIYEIIPAEK